jgi:hypothetical protein
MGGKNQVWTSPPPFNLAGLAIDYFEDAGISLDNNNFIQEAVR